MRQWRAFRCADCGDEVERRRSPGQSLVCVECGVQRMRSQALANAIAKRVRGHIRAVRYLQQLHRSAA